MVKCKYGEVAKKSMQKGIQMLVLNIGMNQKITIR